MPVAVVFLDSDEIAGFHVGFPGSCGRVIGGRSRGCATGVELKPRRRIAKAAARVDTSISSRRDSR
ncbi:hypothetical protein [Lysobacter gummosus]|uniref:hypothetical protein n=1 Tax=Lysobacter gummosus TaxID=262324 RepID=UPI003631FEA1